MTRSESQSLYEDDFFAWTQDQAAALRRASADKIGGHIDVAHIAEEIEDLGRRDFREVTSYLARLLEHLLKIDSAPSSRDVPHWRGEALNFQTSALEAFSPSMRKTLSIEGVWRITRRRMAAAAETGLKVELPDRSPLGLDDLLDEAFDLDRALARLAATRAQNAP